MPRSYIKSIGILLSTILGAGIFALPFSMAKAGLFWNLVHAMVAFCMLLYIGYLYGEVTFFTKGRHRFTGYAELLAGKKAKPFALVTTVISFYGALLIYGVLGGIFLQNILNSQTVGFYTYLFFIFGGLLTYMSLSKVSTINSYIILPLFGFIAYLAAVSVPHFRIENIFSNSDILNEWWLMPFGVWFFAFSGYSAIPEARDLIYGAKLDLKHLKRAILTSLSLSAVFMFVFAFMIYGVSGLGTTQDAFSGVESILGKKVILIGSIMGFLAVFNCFLVLSQDLKNIFRFDYKMARPLAWLVAILPPIFFYAMGFHDLAKTLGLIGTLGLGTSGVLIIVMAKGLRKKIDARDEEVIEKYPEKGELIRLNKLTEALIIILVSVAVVYELWGIFGYN